MSGVADFRVFLHDVCSPVLIGYARVSTNEQSLDMQIAALEKFGVDPSGIYSEHASALNKRRKEFAHALLACEKGDTVVVWKLDRIARSLKHLIEVFENQGITFRSLTEGIETETPGGRLILHVLGAIGQFKRDLIGERSRTGVSRTLESGVRSWT